MSGSKLTVWFMAAAFCIAASLSGGAIAADDASGLGNKTCLSCHDGKSGKLEVPDAEVALVRERVPALMAGVAQLRVPLVADVGVGDNWDQAH